MRVIARVSTEKQVDDGLGVDVQRQAISSWASKKEYRLVGEFTDAGISGSNGLETRAGLGDAFEYLKRRKGRGANDDAVRHHELCASECRGPSDAHKQSTPAGRPGCFDHNLRCSVMGRSAGRRRWPGRPGATSTRRTGSPFRRCPGPRSRRGRSPVPPASSSCRTRRP